MRSNIGGEFWDVPISQEENSIFSGQSMQWFLSGRSALQSIIRELKGCRSVAIPSWCCDSMVVPFMNAGLSVKFYRDLDLSQDILVVMDYFGYSGKRLDLSAYRGIVIRDVTHSIFSSAYDDADYYFGSLRKWCGVWTGGFAWTRDGHFLCNENSDDHGFSRLREEGMKIKSRYMNDLSISDERFLEVFNVSEAVLETVGIAAATERDVSLAKRLDVEGMKRRRRFNAGILMEAFTDWLVFPKMSERDCPLFVPILVPHGRRDGLRRYLMANKIYCPVHWPLSRYHNNGETDSQLYKDELSLVCDQRYGAEDMARVVDTIKAFFKGDK